MSTKRSPQNTPSWPQSQSSAGSGFFVTPDGVAKLLDFGLSRLVIGTSALTDPDGFREACRRFPGKLVLGIDAGGECNGRGCEDRKRRQCECADHARSIGGCPLPSIAHQGVCHLDETRHGVAFSDADAARLAQEAEQRRHPDEPGVIGSPPGVLVDPERGGEPEDDDDEQRQIARESPRLRVKEGVGGHRSFCSLAIWLESPEKVGGTVCVADLKRNF